MIELIVDKDENSKVIAVVENGKLVEIYEENEESKKARNEGNIYLGIVKDIIPGMQAAFVDIGTEKNSFIHVKDVIPQVDEKIEKSLTVENYKEDGPEFTQTKKYLAETKQNLEDGKNKFYELLTEDGAMKYIKEQNVDSYYEDIYNQEIKGYINLEENQNDTVKDAINDVIDVLTVSEKIINFLSENKGSWEIEDNSIVFDTQKLSDEYDKLVSEI